MRYYLHDLFTQTRDTDPDLRFMALNDLEKELESPESKYTSEDKNQFADCLLRCLDDEFAEVRSQALKCFESLSPRLGGYVVSVLNKLSSKKPNQLSITSSIYTMAIHNILKNLTPDDSVGRSIVKGTLDIILQDQDIFCNAIDYIEILTDILEYLGKYFTSQQLSKSSTMLVYASFHADAIIAKKSVSALSILSRGLTSSSILDSILNLALEQVQSSDEIKYEAVYLSIAAALIKSNPAVIMAIYSKIKPYIMNALRLDTLNKPDDDFDVQQDIDIIRSEAFTCLYTTFANVSSKITSQYSDEVLNACRLFLTYDPYSENSSEWDNDVISDNNAEEETDNEYVEYTSEEEQYEEEEECDEYGSSNSWMLRKDAAALIKIIIQKLPTKLPSVYRFTLKQLTLELSESNSTPLTEILNCFVELFKATNKSGPFYTLKSMNSLRQSAIARRGSDVSMKTDDDPRTELELNADNLCKFYVGILTPRNSEKLTLLYEFITQLSCAVEGLNKDWIPKILTALNKLRNGPPSPELLRLYSTLLLYNSLNNFGAGFEIMIENIHASAESSNHELITQGLFLLDKILSDYVTRDKPSGNILPVFEKTFDDLLIDKTLNKNYSTEIRKQCLSCLSNLVIYVLDEDKALLKSLEVFSDTISLEFLILTDMRCIAELTHSEKVVKLVKNEWTERIINRVVEYITTSEFRTQSLKTLLAMMEANILTMPEKRKISAELTNLCMSYAMETSNSILCAKILAHILDTTDCSLSDTFTSLLVRFSKINNFDNATLTQYARAILKHTEPKKMINAISKSGSRSDPYVSRLLAIVYVSSGGLDSIDNVEKNLNSGKDILFSLTFLEQASKSMELHPDLAMFFKLFGDPDTKISEAAVHATAEIVKSNLEGCLPSLVENFTNGKYDHVQMLNCLGEVLECAQLNDRTIKYLFDTLLSIESTMNLNFGKDEEVECQAASKCFANLALSNEEIVRMFYDELSGESSIKVKASLALALKLCLDRSTFLEHNAALLGKYLEEATSENFIFSPNLELKKIGLATLITAVYKRPSVGLPMVSKLLPKILESELTQKKEYIKVVKIGPFKHKLDDGLESRKQIYELIYSTLTAIEGNLNLKILFDVDYDTLFRKLVKGSFKDDPTIIFLCLLIVLKIITLHPEIFSSPDLLGSFIHVCSKKLFKKARAEAPKQDIEKRNDTIKAILRCCKKINTLIEKGDLQPDGDVLTEWRSFYYNTRNVYPIIDADGQ